MSKTIRLEGDALQIAQEIMTQRQVLGDELRSLQERAQRIVAQGAGQEEQLTAALRTKLGLAADACCHLDARYLQEHGAAYVTTGCASSGLEQVLNTIFGQRKQGGLH